MTALITMVFRSRLMLLQCSRCLKRNYPCSAAKKIVTAGSGRTDTGVHARGQVVSLTTSGSIPLENLLKACAGILPKDIVLWQAEEADEGFMPDTALVGNVIVIA